MHLLINVCLSFMALAIIFLMEAITKGLIAVIFKLFCLRSICQGKSTWNWMDVKINNIRSFQ